jgi:translation initiation factor IF-2
MSKPSEINNDNIGFVPRPPVVCVMGHIDHGKSTLLDYIRKTNIVDAEAGGITQHISAYEVVHTDKEKQTRTITFLDTPGHAAFTAMRSRGARVADIAILVVSAEDGVKPQTIEALKCIIDTKTPYIVAITKIDKPGADIERTKNSMVEHEIYVEGYGGSIPCVPISAKSGEGVAELLDMVFLVADMEDLKGDPERLAEGAVIETKLDEKKGIGATIIIKNGTLIRGQAVVCGTALSPVRMMENFLGKQINEATFSSPVRIIGWNEVPPVGGIVRSYSSKKEAEKAVETARLKQAEQKNVSHTEDAKDLAIIPIVLKADVFGSIEAIEHELLKLGNERLRIKIVHSGIGDINESDIKAAGGSTNSLVIGFSVKIDNKVKTLIERNATPVHTFSIIYKLVEFIEGLITERTPKVETEEIIGKAKIMKVFSKLKDKQIIGGKVLEGIIKIGADVKIYRREVQIGTGEIRELQKMKEKTSEVQKDTEFGAMIQSQIEIAPGDRVEAFTIVKK